VTDSKPNYPPIRRVVTGHEGEVAKAMLDAPATNEAILLAVQEISRRDAMSRPAAEHRLP